MIGYIQLTTEVAPGAGTKLLAIKNPDGSYTQVVAVATGQIDDGNSKFLDAPSIATTPGTLQDLITDMVPVGVKRLLSQAIVVFRQEGHFQVSVDGAIILEGKTGPANPTTAVQWLPARPIAAGAVMKLTFMAAIGTVPGIKVSAYIQASDQPI